MRLLSEGRYDAKIINYGIGKTKSGKPRIIVTFQTTNEKHEISYTRTITDGMKGTISEALQVCGYFDSTFSPLAKGPESNLLYQEKTYQIVVEQTQYDGKIRNEIAWINMPGGAVYNSTVDVGEAKSLLGEG